MWQSFVDGKNKLCVSNEILEEYIEILQRLTDNETAEYVVKTILNSPFVELITPFYHFNLITVDPDDNKVSTQFRAYPFERALFSALN